MPPDAGPTDRARLDHMLVAARQALDFANGRSRQDLDTDHMLRRAVINAIQEIGEAATRLGPRAKARVDGIPWDQVVRMRNVLVHVYWGVDLDRVWATLHVDLPPLVEAIERSLASWGSD